MVVNKIEAVNYDVCLQKLGKVGASDLKPAAPPKPLKDFKMEGDDSRILRAIYMTISPKRHLEFGTWKGFGSKLILENTSATVWSINLREGETKLSGSSAYAETPHGNSSFRFFSGIFFKKHAEASDAGMQIGRLVHEAGLGNRFNQIFCDSKHWDASNYPKGFFDSVLIDGSHEPEMVVNDTKKATPLLRSGGIMLWHDYCPDPEVIQIMSSVRGVTRGIEMLDAYLKEHFSECFWINPSWLLVGIKK